MCSVRRTSLSSMTRGMQTLKPQNPNGSTGGCRVPLKKKAKGVSSPPTKTPPSTESRLGRFANLTSGRGIFCGYAGVIGRGEEYSVGLSARLVGVRNITSAASTPTSSMSSMSAPSGRVRSGLPSGLFSHSGLSRSMSGVIGSGEAYSAGISSLSSSKRRRAGDDGTGTLPSARPRDLSSSTPASIAPTREVNVPGDASTRAVNVAGDESTRAVNVAGDASTRAVNVVGAAGANCDSLCAPLASSCELRWGLST
eukprot:306908-Prorocentrum_minimum.AAC.2